MGGGLGVSGAALLPSTPLPRLEATGIGLSLKSSTERGGYLEMLHGGLETGWALETEMLAPVILSLVLDKVLTLLDS